ncbi:MAG: hypothetical protein HXY35_09440 [Chloroflexi bacterium]|nr:hypothetical protein [Chloroflexota bacterium]
MNNYPAASGWGSSFERAVLLLQGWQCNASPADLFAQCCDQKKHCVGDERVDGDQWLGVILELANREQADRELPPPTTSNPRTRKRAAPHKARMAGCPLVNVVNIKADVAGVTTPNKRMQISFY